MNAQLLQKTFGSPFPEEVDSILDVQNGTANCCKFNRWGALVAVGTTDGRIFIFDFITKGIVKNWTAHPHPISSISWSRDGRKILTCSSDTTVVVWDVLGALPLHRMKFGSMIISASFNPRDDTQFLVTQVNHPPSVEYIKPRKSVVLTNDIPGSIEDSMSTVTYDRRAKYIIAGTTKGKIIIYDAVTLKVVVWLKQNSSQQIRQIIIPRRGDYMMTNSQDRVIRSYNLKTLLETQRGTTVEPQYKIQDIVNKASWKSVCTDSEGHYICAASNKGHSLHIWERNGTMVKILNGSKGETLLDCQWHPTRPIIISVANGLTSVWTQSHVENWSAFAPEFTELEENARYVEKEGEFDEEDEDAEEEDHKSMESDEEEIDVVSMKPEDLLCSSDEEDVANLIPDVTLKSGPLWFIPVTPDIENPEQPPLGLEVTQITHPESSEVSRKRPSSVLIPTEPNV